MKKKIHISLTMPVKGLLNTGISSALMAFEEGGVHCKTHLYYLIKHFFNVLYNSSGLKPLLARYYIVGSQDLALLVVIGPLQTDQS